VRHELLQHLVDECLTSLQCSLTDLFEFLEEFLNGAVVVFQERDRISGHVATSNSGETDS
jgi:hypothetical protein